MIKQKCSQTNAANVNEAKVSHLTYMRALQKKEA